MDPEFSARATDLLVESTKESFKAVDVSIGFAVIAVVLVLVHGLQDNYTKAVWRDFREGQKRIHQTNITEEARPSEPAIETDVPLLGVRAELLAATVIAFVIFWVGCIRAALRTQSARRNIKRLQEIDKELAVVLGSWPSIVNGTRAATVWLSLTLALLGVGSCALSQAQVNLAVQETLLEAQSVSTSTVHSGAESRLAMRTGSAARRGFGEIFLASLWMLIPVGYLAKHLLSRKAREGTAA